MNMKIMEAMEYMDEKYIGEVLEAGKKTSGRKNLMRWGSIAACLMLVVGLWMGIVGGTPGTPQEEIVLPPTRYGTVQAEASLARSYTINEAVAEADAVAWVRIGNWLGEDTEGHPIGKTYFEVEVVECYTGNLPSTFVLKQYGSTKGTQKAFPLLTYGNELLLFLNYSETDTSFGGCYYILGGYGTVMDVVNDSNGEVYISPRVRSLGQDIVKTEQNFANNVAENEVAIAMVSDEIQNSFIANSSYVFKLDDIKDSLSR